MTRRLLVSLALAAAGVLALHEFSTQVAAQAPAEPPGHEPGPESMGAPVDSFVAQRDSLVRVLTQSIAGRDSLPADKVFKNVKVLRDVPAARFLRIMDAFGHGLGVSCGYCHVVGKWDLDDKPKKEAARGMLAMVQDIDTDLGKVKNLDPHHPQVGCMTCHRGSPHLHTGMGRPGGPPHHD